jgi:hypothetical protein
LFNYLEQSHVKTISHKTVLCTAVNAFKQRDNRRLVAACPLATNDVNAFNTTATYLEHPPYSLSTGQQQQTKQLDIVSLYKMCFKLFVSNLGAPNPKSACGGILVAIKRLPQFIEKYILHLLLFI